MYISQTINCFAKRLNTHRNNWKNNKVKTNHEQTDQFVLGNSLQKTKKKT